MDKERKNYFQAMASKAEKQFMETEQYEKFINSTPQEKLDTLNSRKVKTPPADYMPNYEKALQHIRDRKPVLFLSIGTTGIDPKSAGAMQATVLIYDTDKEGKKYQSYKDGGMKELADKGFVMDKSLATFVCKTDPDYLDIAEISKRNTGYDIFAEGGFNRAIKDGGIGITEKDYRDVCAGRIPSGICASSKEAYGDKTYPILDTEAFAKNISQWLAYAKKMDAIIIGVAPDFARPFLKNMGVVGYPDDVLDIQELARCHDFKEIQKEMQDHRYRGDFMSNTGTGYKIEDFSRKYNNVDHLYSTRMKALVCRNTFEDILVKENVIDKSLQKTADLYNDMNMNGYVLKPFDAIAVNVKSVKADEKAETGLDNPEKTDGIVSYTSDKAEEKQTAPKAEGGIPTGLVIGGVPVKTENGKIEREVAEKAPENEVKETVSDKEVPIEKPDENDLTALINAKVEEELKARYGKIMDTIDQIAKCLFTIEKDVKELKSVKEIQPKPRKKRMTKAEKESLEKEKAQTEKPAEAEVKEEEKTEAKTEEIKTEEIKATEETKAVGNTEPVKAVEENDSHEEIDDKDER